MSKGLGIFICLHVTCKEFETERDEANCLKAPNWLVAEKEGDPGTLSSTSCHDNVVLSHRLLFHVVDDVPERVSHGKCL